MTTTRKNVLYAEYQCFDCDVCFVIYHIQNIYLSTGDIANFGIKKMKNLPRLGATCSAAANNPQRYILRISKRGCGKSLNWNFHSSHLKEIFLHQPVENSKPSSGQGLSLSNIGIWYDNLCLKSNKT